MNNHQARPLYLRHLGQVACTAGRVDDLHMTVKTKLNEVQLLHVEQQTHNVDHVDPVKLV